MNPRQAADYFTGMFLPRQSISWFVIKYYWILILLSAASFLFEDLYYFKTLPTSVELSYYPLYFIVGALTKSLIQKKIPYTFARLDETRALEAKTLDGLIKDLLRRLNHPFGDTLGVLLGLSIVLFYWHNWRMVLSMTFDRALFEIVVLGLDVVLAYAGGIAIWKIGVTAWAFGWYGRGGQLKIRPFHPDGCGGLAAIGRLFFSFSFILTVVGIFLSGWLVYGAAHPGFHEGLVYAKPWFAGFLIGVVLVSIGFFFPTPARDPQTDGGEGMGI